MKKITLSLLSLIVTLSINSQTIIESDSYGIDQYIEKCSDIPVKREINGGTVFKITYEPKSEWNNAMKGAFEYACKIWEEQLPNTLPINITAKIGTIRGSGKGKLISKVQPASFSFKNMSDSFGNVDENLSSRIKYVLLAEYNSGHNATFVEDINNEDFFNKPDITITYNKNMLDDFSYSLYNTPVNKYDFVTIVLRDIAKGLGFISGFTANSSSEVFQNLNKPKTYYETIISAAIGGSDDAHIAYQNATQGALSLNVPKYGTLNLYAPSNWQNGISLNYFIPDSTKHFSEILNYQLGRGSVIRDITDKYKTLFEYLQGWQTYNLVTGFNEKQVSSEGSTNNMFDYNGSIAISTNSITQNKINNNITLHEEDSNSTLNQQDNFILRNYLFPYDYKYPDDNGLGSWLVSLLKKAGTWDLVYRQGTGSWDIPLEVSMSDLNINPDHSQYQRTCDGYLRCRITHYKQEYDNLYHKKTYNIKNHYYVLDYLPQKIQMGFDSSYSTASVPQKSIADDYTQVIKININGLEGVDKIVVEQLDEGNDLPIKFEVPDFKKGYFTATVDKELYTQFAVRSYNKNGSTKSDYLSIAPLSPVQQLFKIQLVSNKINLTYNKRSIFKNATYVINSTTYNNVTPLKEGVINTTNSTIDISDINSGNYILTIRSQGCQQSLKFSK